VNGFLLDENLPRNLRFILPLPCQHSTDLGRSPSDSDIWNHAKANGLVIISKDADFSARIAVVQPPPWVIHLRIGNVSKREFHAFLKRNWATIFSFLPAYKLVNVYSNRVEATA
jgi:predicted nuclease of predicted toxin-antitoxin system